MKYRKEMVTAAGTLACAVGIGFFMQQGASVPPADFEGAALANADAVILDVEEIVLTSAAISDDLTRPASEQNVTLPAPQDMPVPQSEPSDDRLAAVADDLLGASDNTVTDPQTAVCDVEATARPVAAAMVNLTLSAPCLPNERVTVHHAGMLFNQSTDADGAFNITVPALEVDATFVVAFSNGEGAVAQSVVDELEDYDRVALQWKGDTGFQLHAREFGADYGAEGHVWAGAARDMTFAVTGQGGFIAQLGDPNVPDGLLAEVYTFPASAVDASGDVALSVETEVAQNNCGLEIEAQTLQTFSGKTITSRDLTLSVPDCEAAGNFLVLNNLFEDLKVASN